MGRRGVEPGPR
ncbi:hypothetical protein GBAR_LOCUS7079 [Geodia barretti]|uniref:Uncharacterized protein n=1 Tax=Geodia barretti TaxID=519541 RepID=A0AA35WET1_GEOBA|nr:hypothetical protein GBAR_LOCUS7079 [Geodia barretti]